jgi:type VI secretion system secreted protein Hcp
VRRRLVLLLCVLVPAWALAIPATAPADDFFLQVQGLQGDSTDIRFPNAIDVNSFSWGVASPDKKVGHFSDFDFTKNVDRSSPRLLELVASGQTIPTATLSAVKSGTQRQLYRRFCFTGVVFTRLQSSATAAGGASSESVSFSYATVVERFSPQKADGTPDAAIFGGWDVVKNLPFADLSC